MEKLIDLHTHTVHSDGALTSAQLVEKAADLKLAAIAVADHESTAGIDEAKKIGKKLGVEIIPALEISSYPDPLTEYHFLGYFINHKDKKLEKILKGFREAREERAKKVIKNLNGMGYLINFGDVKALATGTIVQPHLAWAVINDLANKEKLKRDFGEVPDTGDFIRKYLIPGAPAYVARKTLAPKEAIDLIHSIGGLAVFAHPCWSALTQKNGEITFDDHKFAEVVKLGIDGVESLAHRGNEEDTRVCVDHFTDLARKYKLVITGGSDFHGFGSAGKNLGFSDFYLKVPYKVLENLKLKRKKL